MKLFKIQCLIQLICFSSFAYAQERDELVLLKDVAEALGYPSDRLTLVNRTEHFTKKSLGQIVRAYQITSEDNTFAPLSIAVAKRGAILTPDLEAQCQAASANKSPKKHMSVRKVALSGDAYGYTGLGVVGSGGSEERFVVAWPSRGIDMQIKLTIPGDPPLLADTATESYHRLVTGEESDLADKILKAMGYIMAYTARAGIKFASTVSSDNKPVELPEMNSQWHSKPSGVRTIEAKPVTAARVAPESMPWSIIVVLIMAATGLLWLLVKKRK